MYLHKSDADWHKSYADSPIGVCSSSKNNDETSNAYNHSQIPSDFNENWTIMILMMRRCPIQHRELCRSSKTYNEPSNAYNYNQIPSDFDENWTIMILMMRRCPIQQRESCSSSKQ